MKFTAVLFSNFQAGVHYCLCNFRHLLEMFSVQDESGKNRISLINKINEIQAVLFSQIPAVSHIAVSF